MAVIKICDYFLKTNLNGYDAGELIESKIIDCVVENGEDFPFNLDDFIEAFVEENDRFEIIEDSHDWDVEFTPEEVDELVEQTMADGGESEDEEESDESDDYDDDLGDDEE